jgi:choline dehydrogenase-like flavoprotein
VGAVAVSRVITASASGDVDRLFVADHSTLANSMGEGTPTNAGQALAARTAERIVERYLCPLS